MPRVPLRPLRRELLGSALFGVAVVLLFVVGGVAWAVHAPLAGAVIAAGRVKFEGERKTVQHLEGGIIREILVQEGDHVASGSALLVLDDTSARARADELLGRIRTLAGEEARLRAERAHEPAPSFEHRALQDRKNVEVAAVIAQQVSIFAARHQTLQTRKGILLKRIDQIGRQREGLRKQLVGIRSQLRLVRQEETAVAELFDKGYARRPRLLAIQRAEAEFVASEGELIATLARLEEEVNETELQIAGLEADLIETAESRLAAVQAELASAEKLYRETRDRLQRTRVMAPADGVVLDLRFKTVGGVIPPGEPILEIAPVADRLVIDARIRPTDIDEVRVGSRVTVTFPAYAQRNLTPLSARVIRVSADAFTDRESDATYYVASVEMDRDEILQAAPDIRLVAGMPAEIYIATSEHTLYEFLAEPIRRIFARALRET